MVKRCNQLNSEAVIPPGLFDFIFSLSLSLSFSQFKDKTECVGVR